MFRAREENIPGQLVEFFKSTDPRKDSAEFWRSLRYWYQDEDERL